MFLREIYQDPQAPASVLLGLTIKQYGTELLGMEPELVREHIQKDQGIKLSDLQHDKLHAAILVLTTEAYSQDWQAFETINNLLCGQSDTFEDFSPLDVEELIAGLAEVSLINESKYVDGEAPPYDDEVRVYAGHLFYEYGFSLPPTLFPSAIMPVCNVSDDSVKNAALGEIFDSRISTILSYIEKI